MILRAVFGPQEGQHFQPHWNAIALVLEGFAPHHDVVLRRKLGPSHGRMDQVPAGNRFVVLFLSALEYATVIVTQEQIVVAWEPGLAGLAILPVTVVEEGEHWQFVRAVAILVVAVFDELVLSDGPQFRWGLGLGFFFGGFDGELVFGDNIESGFLFSIHR